MIRRLLLAAAPKGRFKMPGFNISQCLLLTAAIACILGVIAIGTRREPDRWDAVVQWDAQQPFSCRWSAQYLGDDELRGKIAPFLRELSDGMACAHCNWPLRFTGHKTVWFRSRSKNTRTGYSLFCPHCWEGLLSQPGGANEILVAYEAKRKAGEIEGTAVQVMHDIYVNIRESKERNVREWSELLDHPLSDPNDPTPEAKLEFDSTDDWFAVGEIAEIGK